MTMETLKLEHIAPYLPCGLLGKSITGNIFILDIASGTGGKGYTKRTIETFITDEYKLLLHPLSSLTKPIQHNGEEFVPIDRLFLLYKPLTKTRLGLEKDIQLYTTQMSYDIIKKLFEWRFAVDIPSHLWIDVNTLDENPYK